MRYTFILTGICAICWFFTGTAAAQDARFTQFYKAPVLLNPAMSGVFSGRVRGHVNYRALYASLLQDNAYETFAAGADIRFTATRKDMASFNIAAVQDRAGVNGYSRTFAAAGGSFIKFLGKGRSYEPLSHYLVVGAQAGFGQYKIDNRELWFSNQYDGLNQEIAFDRDSGEPIGVFNGDLFLDLNVGLLYYLVGEDRLSGFIGGALHHINRPDISFFDDSDEQLYRRYTLHAGGEVALSDKLSILPGAAYMIQGPGTSLSFGSNLRFSNWERLELGLRVGPWFHFSNQLDRGMLMDAFSVAVVFELERWNLGISYDGTTSPLGRSNYARGAVELSLTYFMPGGSRYKVECPEY